jgi:sulfur carrier protein
MIELYLNGNDQQLSSGSSVSEALLAWGYDAEKKIAVAVNGEFLPRSQYGQQCLSAGDKVDVVSPISGG